MKKTVKWAPDGKSCNSAYGVCKLANYGALPLSCAGATFFVDATSSFHNLFVLDSTNPYFITGLLTLSSHFI